VAIVFQNTLTSFEQAGSSSIAADVSDSTTPVYTIAKLNASFEATYRLTVSVQDLTSEIIATADGVVHAVGICPVFAVVWETDEWGGQCSG
jgi:hypothetical protein